MQLLEYHSGIFFGQIFSGEGLKRIKDLQGVPIPINVHDVYNLLGMDNYSSKYIADFATITALLCEPTKKNMKFEGTDIHQQAFNKLTRALTTAPSMAYLYKKKETLVTLDASRALMEVEKRYF